MEYFREVILKIAGIIVLGAVVNSIMPRGTIKKYVSLVSGLVLITAVIKPFADLPRISFSDIRTGESQREAYDLQKTLSESERETLIKIYKQKLCESILSETNGEAQSVSVEISGGEKDFGSIEAVKIVAPSDAESRWENEMRRKISQRFGVSEKRIEIISSTAAGEGTEKK